MNKLSGILINQAPINSLLQWFMGPIDTLFGYWDNLNHRHIEVEYTSVAVIPYCESPGNDRIR